MKAKIENERMIAYLLNAHGRSVKAMGNKRSLNGKIKPQRKGHRIYCFKYKICLPEIYHLRANDRGKQRKSFPKGKKSEGNKGLGFVWGGCCWFSLATEPAMQPHPSATGWDLMGASATGKAQFNQPLSKGRLMFAR